MSESGSLAKLRFLEGEFIMAAETWQQTQHEVQRLCLGHTKKVERVNWNLENKVRRSLSLSPARFHILKIPKYSQTSPPSGDQVFK